MRPRGRRVARAAAAAALVMAMAPAASLGASDGPDAAVRIDPEHVQGGDIADRFVGFSIEWSLIDRYMGPNSRHGFANMLDNLGSGVLRIGGSSQDQVPFDATAPDTERVITPEDLSAVRATLDLANSSGSTTPNWVTVLGTAMGPPTATLPWRSPGHATAFARDGVEPVFGDEEHRRLVGGIALGNEPDLVYSGNLSRYLSEYDDYGNADGVNRFPRIVPNTSENIGTWESLRDRTINVRWFWDWPAVLDKVAPSVTDRAGVLGPSVTDHFYPLARTCPTDPYRCPSIPRLLADERVASFDYEIYTH